VRGVQKGRTLRPDLVVSVVAGDGHWGGKNGFGYGRLPLFKFGGSRPQLLPVLIARAGHEHKHRGGKTTGSH